MLELPKVAIFLVYATALPIMALFRGVSVSGVDLRKISQTHLSESIFNPFLVNVPNLHPLKTPENQRLSGVFRGSETGALSRNGLIKLPSQIFF